LGKRKKIDTNAKQTKLKHKKTVKRNTSLHGINDG